MVSSIGSAGSTIDYTPGDVTDLSAATIRARFSVAALKTEQDVHLMQGVELARLIEPHKGTRIDTRA